MKNILSLFIRGLMIIVLIPSFVVAFLAVILDILLEKIEVT